MVSGASGAEFPKRVDALVPRSSFVFNLGLEDGWEATAVAG